MLESLSSKRVLVFGCDDAFAKRLAILLDVGFDGSKHNNSIGCDGGGGVAFISQSIDVQKLVSVSNVDGVIFTSPFLDKYIDMDFQELVPGMIEDAYIHFVSILKYLSENNKISTSGSVIYLSSLRQKVGESESGASSVSMQSAFSSHLNILSSYLGRRSIRANTILIDPAYLTGDLADSVTETVAFFLSDASAFITAKEIMVDSGQTIHQAML